MIELPVTSDIEQVEANVLYYLRLCFPEEYMHIHGMTTAFILKRILEELIQVEGEK